MSKALNLTEIATAADDMTAALAKWDERMPTDAMADRSWFTKLAAANAFLRKDVEAAGGRFTSPNGDGISVVLGGLRASSTAGPRGACRNWLNAARKKLEAPDT